MKSFRNAILTLHSSVLLLIVISTNGAGLAQAPSGTQDAGERERLLLERIRILEQRLSALEARLPASAAAAPAAPVATAQQPPSPAAAAVATPAPQLSG